MKPCIKILIADDEAPARNRLRELLAELADVEVIAEAKNGQEAIDCCQRQQPDIAILDISMPGQNGIDAAQAMQQMAMPPAIIFSTAFTLRAKPVTLEVFEERLFLKGLIPQI